MKIGIDVGGTNLAAGAVDNNGQIVHSASTPALPENGYASMVDSMAALRTSLPHGLRKMRRRILSLKSDAAFRGSSQETERRS